MEIYSKTTRFALACNASDKIIGRQLLISHIHTLHFTHTHSISHIHTPFHTYNTHFTSYTHSPPHTHSASRTHISEAIQSRCAVLRYSRLSDAQILTRLLTVCDKEKVWEGSKRMCGRMGREGVSPCVSLIIRIMLIQQQQPWQDCTMHTHNHGNHNIHKVLTTLSLMIC